MPGTSKSVRNSCWKPRNLCSGEVFRTSRWSWASRSLMKVDGSAGAASGMFGTAAAAIKPAAPARSKRRNMERTSQLAAPNIKAGRRAQCEVGHIEIAVAARDRRHFDVVIGATDRAQIRRKLRL